MYCSNINFYHRIMQSRTFVPAISGSLCYSLCFIIWLTNRMQWCCSNGWQLYMGSGDPDKSYGKSITYWHCWLQGLFADCNLCKDPSDMGQNQCQRLHSYSWEDITVIYKLLVNFIIMVCGLHNHCMWFVFSCAVIAIWIIERTFNTL